MFRIFASSLIQYPLALDSKGTSVFISEILKRLDVTPYIYVRNSLRQLVQGEYKEAYRLLELAGGFEGVFYEKNTAENEDYAKTIELLKYIELHLADEFKKL